MKREVNRPVPNEGIEVAVLGHMKMEPTQSLRKISQAFVVQNLLYHICFPNECTFMMSGEVNTHNCRYWSDTIPHSFRETHTQHPHKLIVWAEILGNHIVGPFFIDGNLNEASYRELLENTIDSMNPEIVENADNLLEDQIMFHQDGARSHYAVQVREFLNERYPARRIGRRGAIE